MDQGQRKIVVFKFVQVIMVANIDVKFEENSIKTVSEFDLEKLGQCQ